MRYIVGFALLMVLMLLFCACGASKQPAGQTPSPRIQPMIGHSPNWDGRNVQQTGDVKVADSNEKITRSDEEWRRILTPEQYRITRQRGTERAFSGAYWNEHAAGVYACVGCGLELFDSGSKFESGTGWPSFYEEIAKGRVEEEPDLSHGMKRVEVHCSRCGAHLGHVFDDGPKPTGLRYCINSPAIVLKERK